MNEFEHLLPDRVINAAETYLGVPMSGLAVPLPSYINRVYELQSMAGERYVAKFYRPGRWEAAAIAEEHRFIFDCAAEEIPVITPTPSCRGETLMATDDGVVFTVFPKKFGRELEILCGDDWRRIGRVAARIHLAGARRSATHRTVLTPEESTAAYLDHLMEGDYIPASCRPEFYEVAERLYSLLEGRFDGIERIRIHGDCHRGNILERPDEGLMIIDFDDMMTGPPVQDLWLLLPEHVEQCRRELDLVLDGYCELRDFDFNTIQLIEPLRAMRMIYFLAWCSTQMDDFKFRANFPDWGSEAFWRREIGDLRRQLELIRY
jgi:Ser/Thr protein kinase RdoA (MazF antagonist)